MFSGLRKKLARLRGREEVQRPPRSLPKTPSNVDADPWWSSAWTVKHRLMHLALGGLGVYCAVEALSPEGHSVNVYSWLCAGFMGCLSFHALRRALDSRPRLELTPGGIIDRTGFGGGDMLIPWEEILDIRYAKFGGGLQIAVRDPSRIRKRAGWPRRAWMMLGATRGKRTFTIGSDAFGPNIAGLGALIEARMLAFEREDMGLLPWVDTDLDSTAGR